MQGLPHLPGAATRALGFSSCRAEASKLEAIARELQKGVSARRASTGPQQLLPGRCGRVSRILFNGSVQKTWISGNVPLVALVGGFLEHFPGNLGGCLAGFLSRINENDCWWAFLVLPGNLGGHLDVRPSSYVAKCC